MKTKYNDLKKGTEIYYTGDQANPDGFGQIINVYKNNFYPIIYDIEIDTNRCIFRHITPASFDKVVGRRFILKSEYITERNKKIKELKLRISSK